MAGCVQMRMVDPNVGTRAQQNTHSTSGVWGYRSGLFSPATAKQFSITDKPPLNSILICIFRTDGAINLASRPARLETAHSASATYFGVIYPNSILNVQFL
ncbi:hypothetical protein Zmor_016240 [Zophobas morio]|uniref:Uncharacterized protein n=1 Tax=Zophobas morio TaxID=2755281 RepID=A0AA38IQ40_9CUCU|nr:hypothetical protein Zmor_016240 [Zophobas morio]